MLVLTRKPGEAVHIGGGIVVTVVEVQGGKVKLGIAAPREVVIDRDEVAAVRDDGEGENREGEQDDGGEKMEQPVGVARRVVVPQECVVQAG